MRRNLLVAGLLVAAGVVAIRFSGDPASGGAPVRRPVNADEARGRLDRNPPTPALEVLPAGSGQSFAHRFCETALRQGALSGTGALCIDGYGVVDASGAAITDAGGLGANTYVATIDQCANGPNCNPVKVITHSSGVNATYSLKLKPSTPGSFSSFGAYVNENWVANGYQDIVQVTDNYGGRYNLTYVTTALLVCFPSSPDGGQTILTATSHTNDRGIKTGACTTIFDGGSSWIRGYRDGSLGGQSASAGGMPQVGPATTMANAAFEGYLIGALWTEQALTATQIASLDSAARGTLTGSRGEAITTTRNSTMFCTSEDESAGTTLPANKACVRKGGLVSEPAATNLLLRSEELDTGAVWVADGAGGAVAPVITANAVIAPDGTLTAERISFDTATSGGRYSYVYQAVTTTASKYAFSVWARKISGTSSTLELWVSDGSNRVGLTSCTLSTTKYTRCVVSPASALTAVPHYFVLGGSNPAVPATPQSDLVADIWGAQLETGTYASSYIRTEGTTAARVASYTTVSSSLADIPTGANTAYCMGATWVPPYSGGAFSDYSGAGFSIVGIGGPYSSANQAFLTISGTGGFAGKVALDTFDNGTNNKYRFSNTAITWAEHRIVGCNDRGTFQIWVDGVPLAMQAAVGAGTGLMTTMPSSHYVGALGSGVSAYQSRGILKDICYGPLGSCL